MENLFQHEDKKRENIINSALKVFSQNGYKKASINDIAIDAKISKSIIFYYFSNKKSLYLHLIKLCVDKIYSEYNKFDVKNIDCFFERIRTISNIKFSIFKKSPYLLPFLKSIITEKDKNTIEEIHKFMENIYNSSMTYLVDGLDKSKFKEDASLNEVLKIITWTVDGFANEINQIDNQEEAIKTLFSFLDIMQNHFYK